MVTRRVPWLLAAEVAVSAKRHWDRLTPGERAQLAGLVRRSRGRRSNLTSREWDELRRLVRKLDLVALGRDFVPMAGAMRRRR